MKDKLKELLRPIIKEILSEIKQTQPTKVTSDKNMYKSIFGLDKNETKKAVRTSIKEAAKGLNLSQPWSNLHIKGWGKDRNGNMAILVGFPNDKGWAIQTNQNLPTTHSILTTTPPKLSSNDLDAIGEEITDYVDQYGSKEQKSRLKRY